MLTSPHRPRLLLSLTFNHVTFRTSVPPVDHRLPLPVAGVEALSVVLMWSSLEACFEQLVLAAGWRRGLGRKVLRQERSLLTHRLRDHLAQTGQRQTVSIAAAHRVHGTRGLRLMQPRYISPSPAARIFLAAHGPASPRYDISGKA
jgi:hypothetical protein